MKHKLTLLTIAILSLTLASCDFIPSLKPSVSSSIESEESTSSSSSSEESSYSTEEISSSSEELSSSSSSEESLSSSSSELNPGLEKVDMAYNYKDLAEVSAYGEVDYCPSEEMGMILVIPIWFNDSDEFIAIDNRDEIRDDIELAYFGEDSDVGYKSVKTYYEADSFGRVTLDGVVSDWYEIDESYEAYKSDTYKTINLVKQAVDWYKTTYDDQLMDFDYDTNGYIDGVMLIYAAPDQQALGRDDCSNLWAYCYWVQDSSLCEVSSPGPNAFFWASYDFMYSMGSDALTKTGKSNYGSGHTEHLIVDTHTFIHEMGHVFGLDDYYDYYNGNRNPLGGLTMQDYNVGAHDPMSRLSLGWVDPYVITDTATVKITASEIDGDVILIKDTFTDSPFDEYILVDLYAPIGLNEFVSEYGYRASGWDQLPSTIGVRIWHIDNKLEEYTYNYGQWEGPDGITDLVSEITNDRKHLYNTPISNTSGGNRVDETYASYNQNFYIRNSGWADLDSHDFINANNLFYEGDTFTLEKFNKQFVNGTTFDNGDEFPFTIEVKKIDGYEATIEITRTSNNG